MDKIVEHIYRCYKRGFGNFNVRVTDSIWTPAPYLAKRDRNLQNAKYIEILEYFDKMAEEKR